jgi:two-component system response regulator PrrA
MEKPQRVLVVDDDRDIRELLGECLHDQFSVTLAEGGTEALEAITQEPERFDALVIDLEMPCMDGAELIEELRHRDIDVPVLIISAVPDAQARAQQVRAEFISKPFDPSCLQDKVGRLLRAS